jgi:hypothetical protein
MDKSDFSAAILAKPVGTLLPVSGEQEAALYVREDAWRLRKYTREFSAEFRLGVWDLNPVIVVGLVLRFGHQDACTFDLCLNMALPDTLRLTQNLASQSTILAHVVAEDVTRTFRLVNAAKLEAAQAVNLLYSRDLWPPAAFQAALTRINQLYPTAPAVWRACEPPPRG